MNTLSKITKSILFTFAFLAILVSFSSCKKAGKVLLISAHPWVVTSAIGLGDEYQFYDNRLLFITSNSVKIDGKWAFERDEYQQSSSITPGTSITNLDVSELTITTDVSSVKYRITKITETELELEDMGTSFSIPLVLTAKTE